MAEKYVPISAYAYVGNMPTRAIDPDGRRIFFVGGANNDQDGWNYIQRWGAAFGRSGVQGFSRINASQGRIGDIDYTTRYRSNRRFNQEVYAGPPGNPGPNPATRMEEHPSLTSAYNQIKSNNAANPLEENEQFNLAGYSYGSVLQAQVALKLADEGTFIDNLILIGSPISDNSNLYKELSGNGNIGNILRVDIEGDLLSNPADVGEFIRGAFQNAGDDGPHFNLARPGAETNRLIQVVTDWLSQQGVE